MAEDVTQELIEQMRQMSLTLRLLSVEAEELRRKVYGLSEAVSKMAMDMEDHAVPTRAEDPEEQHP